MNAPVHSLRLNLLEKDVSELYRVAFGLEADGSAFNFQVSVFDEEFSVIVVRVELNLFIAHHVSAVDAVDDFAIAVDLDFGLNPGFATEGV